MSMILSKSTVACLLTALSVFFGTAFAADYVFRDVMGNTLPSQKCSQQPQASDKASDPYTVKKFAKTFCEIQGYGWNLVEEKNNGTLVCQECEGANDKGAYQCHMEDVVVTCKRLKPGSVGLFPGKG